MNYVQEKCFTDTVDGHLQHPENLPLCVTKSWTLSLSRQIKVAVSADRDCIRAYQPQISSANYNTLTLTVKTQEPDNLLFYLGSSTSVSERPGCLGIQVFPGG